MNQTSFLDGLQREEMNASVAEWRAPELPELSRFDDLIIDLETTGLRWWDRDRMIGMGLWTPDGRTRYLPIRHQGGQNLCEETFFRWCKRELRGKKVTNVRTKFDLHMLREDGVNLEEQGCTFADVAHYAALLDDHRRKFNQEDLVKDFLPADTVAGKVKHAHGFTLDPAKFKDYPAGIVAPRAENDVLSVALLRDVMWPRLTAEDLHRVRALEEEVIPVVVEMEHNGAPIDVETLARWCISAQKDLEDAMWQVQKLSGCKLTTPNKNDDLAKMFATLHIDVPLDPDTGEPSFAEELLAPIAHPAIQKLRYAKQMKSLLSKFLLKYQKDVHNGILRYELHQLPYQDDDDGGGGGAVSGRFASSAITLFDERGVRFKFGANIQQVIGAKKQKKAFTRDYIIKCLFRPQHGLLLDADASQLQFRLFAHYANAKAVIDAYNRDPDQDYHELVNALIVEYANRELDRTHTKNVNFAQVFGAGVRKMAKQLGVPASQIPSFEEAIESGGPDFQKVVQLNTIYHEKFPDVKPMQNLASHLAAPGHTPGKRGCDTGYGAARCRAFYRKGYKHRGYVTTYLGRRARFGMNDRHYSSLVRVIQGTEGDVNKRVMIEMHKLRKELSLIPRFSVHDAWVGDCCEPDKLPRIEAAFNTQYYPFRVPILWDLKVGPNWGEVTGKMKYPKRPLLTEAATVAA